jgi:hypothetical protein
MIKTLSVFLIICMVEVISKAAIAAPAQQSAAQLPADVPTQQTPIATIKIISPTPNQIIDLPSTSITAEYPIDAQIELQVNGVAVDNSLIGRTETDTTNQLITQTWYGISLEQGENVITAMPTTPGLAPSTIKVQVRGGVKKLTLQSEAVRIPADGRSTTTIQGQLIDANGNRTNQNATVTLAASAGEFVEKDANPKAPGFQVQAKQGQFSATLRSGLEAKTVTIRALIADIEAFTQLQFETDLRPSIATGVIDVRLGRSGTDFYQSFREFLPPDDNKTKLDIYGAAFATGKVGEWLFTGAYNSDRTLNRDCNGRDRLFRDTQPCEQAYPTYGDDSQVTALTPSQDSVYLRFERSPQILNAEPDYAMWGDFNTQEFARTSQQFSATTRQLHGFKANYNWGNLQITGFYGNNVQGFQRDAIAPDGTSGYYFLSRRLLLAGSENVFIELEELNRPGTVVSRQQLTRGIDYDIDYDRGTLLFRQPVLRTDVDQTGQVLRRQIIATYQYESQENNRNTIYGGRLQYHLSRQRHPDWIGATYLQENQGVRSFELYGADALISLGDKTRFIAEYAHSTNNSEFLGTISGSAYRLEAIAEIAQGIRASAYFRTADTGFANNATISFVPGQTRYGAQVVGKLSPQTNLRLQYDREVNQGIAPEPVTTFEDLFTPRIEPIPGSRVDNSLTTILAGVEHRIGKANVTVDWIHRQREDRIAPNALSGTSDQVRSRLTLPLTDNLTFLAQNELSFSDQADAVYPDRTILGLDWGLLPGVNLRLAQQFYTRGQFAGNSITSIEVVGEHKFSQNTILTGRYSMFGGLNDFSGQGAIGLKHRWEITPSLKLNLAYERILGDFFGRTAAGLQFAQPFAPGQSAASLGFSAANSYSIGVEYNPSSNFQANARYEHRTSPSGSNTVIGANVTGKISPALTALVRYQQANFSNQKLAGLGNTVNFKAGLAYRDPHSDKFNALLRYEYRKNPATIPDTLLLGTGTGYEDHTFALEALYAPNWQWEFYGKYALRNSTSYLATDLVGTSTINLAQLRATYRLGYSVDLVGEARWIHQPTTGFSETGFVVEAGYYLTPNLRLSAGYAFGDVSDRDFSGSRSAGGAYLGLTLKLNELFDGFGLQKPVPKPISNHTAKSQQ